MDTNLIVAIAASAVAFVTLVLTTIYRARELKELRCAERRAEMLRASGDAEASAWAGPERTARDAAS